jgi:hypothetical protein
MRSSSAQAIHMSVAWRSRSVAREQRTPRSTRVRQPTDARDTVEII